MNLQTTYANKKAEYGNKLLLMFNVNGNYRSYFKDASIISGILRDKRQIRLLVKNKTVSIWREVCSEKDLNQVRNRILNAGYGVCTIQKRKNGKFKI